MSTSVCAGLLQLPSDLQQQMSTDACLPIDKILVVPHGAKHVGFVSGSIGCLVPFKHSFDFSA